MIDSSARDRDKHRFLESLGRLFRLRHDPAGEVAERAPADGGFAKLEADFEAAIGTLTKRMDEKRRVARRTMPQNLTVHELAEERQRRKDVAHHAMREDIEEMHVELRTGLSPEDLSDIVAFLEELDHFSKEGRGSLALIPRARYAITLRLRAEAGVLATDRLILRLQRRGIDWPDPTLHHPHATAEEIEASRRRRLRDVRRAFLAYDLERIAERIQGIVWGWGGDYPDRGTPLWRECVLVGVAAGIWGRLIQHLVELVRQDREVLLARTQEALGDEVAILQAAIDCDSTSLEECKEVVSSSLRAIDEIVPEIAWQLVRTRLPRSEATVAD